MKHSYVLLLALSMLACAMRAQEPIDALLIVQNHVSDEFQKPLSDLGDRLSGALSGDIFNIIDPNDIVGDEQNRGPWGEKMPISSATRLAENLDAQALVTAAINEASVVNYGVPPKARAVRMTLTISAKKLPKGATVASVTVTETSRKMTVNTLSQNEDAAYSELVGTLVAKASAQFLAKGRTVAWKDVALKTIEVAFGCNFPGADVSIDGVSYGTAGTIGQAPLKVKVSDGLHNLRISYPYTEPFEVRAKLQEGTTFMVVLRENEEGRRIRKEDAHFDALIDRIYKSGATDDEVRLLRAKGYGKYLESSYTRIHGMPKVLSMRDCEMPDFGLNPDKEGDGVETRTGDLLNAAAEAAGVSTRTAQPTAENGAAATEVQPAGDEPAATDGQRQSEDDNVQNVSVQVQPQNPIQAVQQQATEQIIRQPDSVPTTLPQSVRPAPAPQQNNVLQGLRDVREGVGTSKEIVQELKDIGDILK